MPTAKFLLEHFYYGQLVHDGKPRGEPRLLAASAGVKPELAALAVERVTLPPLIRADNGAWALVRGRHKSIPFLLVQAQQGSAGQLIAHYILAPPDTLRTVGGNLQALLALVQDTLPVFDRLDQQLLDPVALAAPPSLSMAAQVDYILDLMNITRNRIDIIELLLAAIVQGVQLIVQGAPPNLRERVAFVQGLLALLPPSARFGVTFTTHSLPTTDIDAQIRFYSDDMPPTDTTVFNWPRAQVTGVDLEDDYSRFVMSQLRLDAELVIQRNTQMTLIAGWRLNQGDKLAAALGYAAQRVRLDEALRNKQPVNHSEVARILGTDPTLTDELRVLYADHLITFSLAMEDMSHAAPVAELLPDNPELEQAALRRMGEALNDGRASLVYDTLLLWLGHPQGPHGPAWVDLTQRTLLEYARGLVARRDLDGIVALISRLHAADSVLDLPRVAPPFVARVLPVCQDDPALAESLFLLGIKYLDAQRFAALMDRRDFLQQLPQALRSAWVHIRDGGPPASPAGLVKVSKRFGADWDSVLLRFAELAVHDNRLALVSTPVLVALLEIAQGDRAQHFRDRLLWLVGQIEELGLIGLEPPGPLCLLQIRLVLGDYETLARQMLNQSAQLYPGDHQVDYLLAVDTLFGQTPLEPEAARRALQTASNSGVRSIPLIVAGAAALRQHPGAPALKPLARQIVELLYGMRQDIRYMADVLPSSTIPGLLRCAAAYNDSDSLMSLAEIVPLVVEQGGLDAPVLAEMVGSLPAEPAARRAGLHMLRAYVRSSDDQTARRSIKVFGTALGDDVRRALEVTVTLREVMGGLPIEAYAGRVRQAVEFLEECAAAYLNPRNPPSIHMLTGSMSAFSGSMPADDRRRLSAQALDLGRTIVDLGRQYRAVRGRNEASRITQLMSGEEEPRCALDALRVMSSGMAAGLRYKSGLKARPYPFEGWSAQQFAETFDAASAVLSDLLAALPGGHSFNLSLSEIRDELASILAGSRSDAQRASIEELALDVQRLADVVARIEADGDARAIESGSFLGRKLDAGKQRPRSVLEFLRLVYTYYRSA